MSAPRAARSSLSHARPASTLLLVVLLFAFFMLFLMYLYAKAKKCVPGALVAQGAHGRSFEAAALSLPPRRVVRILSWVVR